MTAGNRNLAAEFARVEDARIALKKARAEVFVALVKSGMSEIEAIRRLNRALIVKDGRRPHTTARDAVTQLAPHQWRKYHLALEGLHEALRPFTPLGTQARPQ
jgi:hypothetical protein